MNLFGAALDLKIPWDSQILLALGKVKRSVAGEIYWGIIRELAVAYAANKDRENLEM